MTAPRDCSKATAMGRPPKRCASSAAQVWMASGVLSSSPRCSLPSAVRIDQKCFRSAQSMPMCAANSDSWFGLSRSDIFLLVLFSLLLTAGQAGPYFRECLIVESGYQTASECSFWKQGASRGRSSDGRLHAAARHSIVVRERYSYPRDACSLSYLVTDRRRWQLSELFHRLSVATAVENSMS